MPDAAGVGAVWGGMISRLGTVENRKGLWGLSSCARRDGERGEFRGQIGEVLAGLFKRPRAAVDTATNQCGKPVRFADERCWKNKF